MVRNAGLGLTLTLTVLRYGVEVVQYYSTPYRDRQNPEMAIRNNIARNNISSQQIFPILFDQF